MAQRHSRFLHLFRPESHRIEAHLLYHGYQSVRTGGREVLFETYLLDKVQICVKYLLRCMVIQDLNQQGDNAFDNDGITLSLEVDLATHEVCLQPNTTLAALDEVALCLIALVKRRQGVAQVY